MLAVEEAAPAGGAGELRQHRVELAQRLRQVPAVLPRRCRAATAASGPDRTFPTRPDPDPARPRAPTPAEGREEKGEGRERGPARPLSPPLTLPGRALGWRRFHGGGRRYPGTAAASRRQRQRPGPPQPFL